MKNFISMNQLYSLLVIPNIAHLNNNPFIHHSKGVSYALKKK